MDHVQYFPSEHFNHMLGRDEPTCWLNTATGGQMVENAREQNTGFLNSLEVWSCKKSLKAYQTRKFAGLARNSVKHGAVKHVR